MEGRRGRSIMAQRAIVGNGTTFVNRVQQYCNGSEPAGIERTGHTWGRRLAWRCDTTYQETDDLSLRMTAARDFRLAADISLHCELPTHWKID